MRRLQHVFVYLFNQVDEWKYVLDEIYFFFKNSI